MRTGSLVICLLLSLWFSGCALWPQRTVQEDPRTKAENQFDPLGFPQDQVIVTEKEPDGERESTSDFESENRIRAEGSEGAEDLFPLKVYRVQFFATKYPDDASQVAESVAAQLSEKAYIEYKAPYYWVRVGDCQTKEESDSLLGKIKRLGYRESWVVEVEIQP
jgi:hypothetical protein